MHVGAFVGVVVCIHHNLWLPSPRPSWIVARPSRRQRKAAADMEASAEVQSILEAYRSGAAEELAACVGGLLKSGGFPKAKEALAGAARLADAGFRRMLLRCQLASSVSRDQALPYLLADAVSTASGDEQAALASETVSVAMQLASQEASKPPGRLVAKLLSGGVRDEDLDDAAQQSLAAFIRKLSAAKDWTACVTLLCEFPRLRVAAGASDVLLLLAETTEQALAEKLATALGAAAQVALIEAYQQADHLKSAALAVKSFGLEAQYPEAERTWKTKSLEKAIESGKKEAVVGLSTGLPYLHQRCVDGLMELEEVDLAVELAGAWGVALSKPPTQEALEERERRRQEAFLQMPTTVQVVFVNAEQQLQEMVSASKSCGSVLGFDVEWRPAADSPPSVLQLGGGDLVFIIDLISLSGSESLGQALGAIFGDTSVVKLGFDGAKDFARVAEVIPGLRAACGVPDASRLFMDIRHIYAELLVRNGQAASTKKAVASFSLSSMAENILGRPLDKSMQMSDWGRRPLSGPQSRYAAMDAWVLPEMYRKLTGEVQ
eukprot:TRINITY_DN83903_c0_g1_i1.p1 TRINITY_DN83903_c0_g1~~TRINITY_DN83903_c0_g1_i1.p1  ORF type:complete len:549 (-),score=129.97 TRINITY_DN83903_c0_g1_i1:4-1650(-)